MESRYVLEKPMAGGVDFNYRSVLRDTRADRSGPRPVYTNGSVHYSFIVDGGSSLRNSSMGTRLPSGGRILHDMEKTGRGDQKDTGPSGTLKRASPTNCPSTNGQAPGSFMTLDIRNPEKQAEKSINFRVTPGQNVAPAEKQACTSSHIPVPRNRKPSGHADKEVMAATVLTSLSTSPLVLCPASVPTVPEPTSRVWKEALSTSYSSSTSGNWSWDASDQSVPSTPSPPLLSDANKSFLASHGDDVNEDATENTHFMFEDPIPRKRKNSMKVMFKCLWKNCDKVLSTSSGIQRHVRTVHLGRNSDSDYSDGEEDFYYSEIEVNMDSLSDGLSNLAPTSPTTCGPSPVFPPPLTAIPHSENIAMKGLPCHAPTLLSQSAPSTLCHIRTDHAYQGPVTHIRTVNFAEKRQPVVSTNATVTKNHPSNASAAKATPGNRKPRGEAKKCRKVYGMEKRDMWCTACRWKKACQRFTD